MDAEAVADVLLLSRKAFLPYLPSPRSDAEVRAWIRDTVLPNQAVTVALTQNQVAGLLAVDERDGTTWITHLYVRPPHVGQGIGSRLLAYAMDGSRGAVRLYCFQRNERARRFYERHGFKAIAFSDGSANEERCPDVLYERLR